MKLNGLTSAEFLFYDKETDTAPQSSSYVKVDGTSGFPTEIQIQNLSGTAQPHYGGDVLAYQNVTGNGAVSGSFNALDLPKSLTDKLLGYTVDPNGISHHGKNTRPPYVAVVFTSHHGGSEEAWLGLPKVVFSRGDVQAQTNTNEPVENNDQLTFNASNATNGDIFLEGVAGDTATAAAFRTAVFGSDPTSVPSSN